MCMQTRRPTTQNMFGKEGSLLEKVWKVFGVFHACASERVNGPLCGEWAMACACGAGIRFLDSIHFPRLSFLLLCIPLELL